MEIDQYAKFTRTTATYRGAGKGTRTAIEYNLFGLCGEVGEIANKYAKVLRDGAEGDWKGRMADECGDAFYYLVRLTIELGFHPEVALDANVAKLEDRKRRGKIKGSGDNR